MEPRFNIRVAELGQPSIDNDFIDPNVQWDGDYLSIKPDYERNQGAYQEYKDGELAKLDGYAEQASQNAQMANPAQDRALMVQEPEVAGTRDLQLAPVQSSKLASQANGFRREQAHETLTLGIVANADAGTLVNARVLAETPSTKIAGTVLAVGDAEFAVLWDDKTASVERKADYELVFAQ